MTPREVQCGGTTHSSPGTHRRSGIAERSLATLVHVPKPLNDISNRTNLVFLNLAGAQRQNLQERHSRLILLIALDVLYHDLDFAILSNDERFGLA